MNASSQGAGWTRIVWMILGPAVLALLLVNIATTGSGWFTPQDIAFFLVLATVVFVRWYEFQGGYSQTSMGDPATPMHLRRYLVGAVPVGVGLWVAANLLGNFWLGR